MALLWWQKDWDPFEEVTRLQEEINRLFDNRGWSRGYGGRWAAEFPAVNLYETDHGYELHVEIPGVAPEDLDLSISATTITFKGERKMPATKDKKILRQERSYGHFARAITLPEHIDNDKVEAHYANGLLKIYLPKREEAKPKQIEVKVS